MNTNPPIQGVPSVLFHQPRSDISYSHKEALPGLHRGEVSDPVVPTNIMISCLKYAFDQKTDIILMQKS